MALVSLSGMACPQKLLLENVVDQTVMDVQLILHRQSNKLLDIGRSELAKNLNEE